MRAGQAVELSSPPRHGGGNLRAPGRNGRRHVHWRRHRARLGDVDIDASRSASALAPQKRYLRARHPDLRRAGEHRPACSGGAGPRRPLGDKTLTLQLARRAGVLSLGMSIAVALARAAGGPISVRRIKSGADKLASSSERRIWRLANCRHPARRARGGRLNVSSPATRRDLAAGAGAGTGVWARTASRCSTRGAERPEPCQSPRRAVGGPGLATTCCCRVRTGRRGILRAHRGRPRGCSGRAMR